mmetsp:Transcript_34357/g.77415  ORF Transcript_34357/g.77415 Transcript_34357/m.77415 type:complete len:778 (-) Transcript_34357:547-2880(-)
MNRFGGERRAISAHGRRQDVREHQHQNELLKLYDGEGVLLTKMAFNQERFSAILSKLNGDAGRNVDLATKLSRDLGKEIELHRRGVNELVAELMRYLKRVIEHQDVFETLIAKARKDVLQAELTAEERSVELQRERERVDVAGRSSSARIAELEEKLRVVQEELDQATIESKKPAWQDADKIHDPTSEVTSREWYEAEIAYLNNRCSQLSVQCETLLLERVARFSDGKSNHSSWIEGRRSRRNSSVQQVNVEAEGIEWEPPVDSCTQTEEEELVVDVHEVSPALVCKGSLCHPPHRLLLKRIDTEWKEGERRFHLILPEHLKLVYEDIASSPESHKGRQLQKRKTFPKKSKTIRLDQARSFEDIANHEFAPEHAPLPLRTVSRWIGEVWVAWIRHVKDEAAPVPLEPVPVSSCDSDFGPFIWKHFLHKYGSDQEAAGHVADFVDGVRRHRKHHPRVRIFAEFAGLEARRPMKALKLFATFLETLLPSSTTEDDNALVWVRPESVVSVVNRELKPKVLKGKADRFLDEMLPKMVTTTANDPQGRLVDLDMCVECLTNLMLEEEFSVFHHILDPLLVSEDGDAISQEEFERIVLHLDQTLDGGLCLEKFHSFKKQRPGEEIEVVSCEDVITILKQLPHEDYQRTLLGHDGKELQLSNYKLLQATLEHYWYMNHLRIRQTISDLENKRARLSGLLQKFTAAYSLSSSSVERTLELLMLSRMITAELLLEKTETVPRTRKIARPSFFQSTPARKDSIIRSLLPRGLHLNDTRMRLSLSAGR